MWRVVVGEEGCGHRCGAGEAAGRHLFEEGRRSRVWMGRLALWELASVATRSCDWARSGKRSAESPDVAVVRRSRAGRVEDQTSRRLAGLLLGQPKLELVALDRHNLTPCPDEEPVTLSQDVAEAG